ncbi:MAG TPA: nucleotidyltransferase [Thermoanaerobaculia bacterium]|jgi:predicted nucleotidyltransferase|nr:nucleotidyltransferase [Thermoanaerobaculia bacterium]
MAAERSFNQALRAVMDALDEIPGPSMIIGGVAVIASGVPRQTVDIDATVLGRTATLDKVVASFARHGMTPRVPGAVEFARERQVLLLQHDETGVTMEVSFAWLPFEEEALARAKEIDIEGFIVRIAVPEDLIVYKAAAWRDRDIADIERLLALYLKTIDLDRVRNLVRDIGVALDDPGRIDAFDALVERVRAAK